MAVLDLSSDSTECTMTSCFNFTKCSVTEGLRVYFYPFDSAFSSSLSALNLFHTRNIYITSAPSEACLFVIDTSTLADFNNNKNINAQLLNQSTKYNDGTNYILINSEAKDENVDKFLQLTTARTILAQSNFDKTKFRPGYDIVIPKMSKTKTENKWKRMKPIMPIERIFLFSFLGFFSGKLHNHGRFNVNDVVKYFNNIQSKLGNNIYITTTCKYSNSDSIHDEFLICMNESERMEVLKRSTFSLILPSNNISHKSTEIIQFRITEALKFGAIPVIFGDDLVLPFIEIFDWRNAAIIIPVSLIQDINLILKKYTVNTIMSMQHAGKLLYQAFSDYTYTVSLILTVLKHRLGFPPLPDGEKSNSVVIDNKQGENINISKLFSTNDFEFLDQKMNLFGNPFMSHLNTPLENINPKKKGKF